MPSESRMRQALVLLMATLFNHRIRELRRLAHGELFSAVTHHLQIPARPSSEQSRRTKEMERMEKCAEKATIHLDVIEKLIETCRDGQAGYLEAAEHARNSRAADVLLLTGDGARQICGRAGELARHLGEADPDSRPSMAVSCIAPGSI